jgi:hypothetical protein
MEPAGRDPMLNCPAAETEVDQLPIGHHLVLSLRQRSDRRITWAL